MTIGGRIKYCRKKAGFTQYQLSMISGVNHASIRKYETDMIQPQEKQIEKIAKALNVSYNAIYGITDCNIRLKTVGDFMGVLMLLYKANIIQIQGERDSSFVIDSNSAKIVFNNIFSNFISFSSTNEVNELNGIFFKLKDSILLDDFLLWESYTYICNKTFTSETEHDRRSFNHCYEFKSELEIELQSNDTLLR